MPRARRTLRIGGAPSVPEVRIIARHTRLRTSESKPH